MGITELKNTNWDKEAAEAMARREKYNKPWDVIDTSTERAPSMDPKFLKALSKPNE